MPVPLPQIAPPPAPTAPIPGPIPAPMPGPAPMPMPGQVAARLSQVGKHYRLGATALPALVDLSLTLQARDFAVIVGPSGSGKTTLLNLIGCIDRPDTGRVEVLGQDVTALSERELTRLRRDRIGFIFQNFALIPVLSAAENVEYPLVLAGVAATERRLRVAEALDMVGLGARASHRPNALSGGQRQRVAIARALIKRPALVIADEPTANLDSRTGQDLMTALRRMQADLGTTFVIATHDPEVQAHAGRRFRLRDGHLVTEES